MAAAMVNMAILGGGAYAAPPANPAAYSVVVQCDRACYERLLDQALDAMVARDISRLPLSPTVRATENGVARLLTDGLWQTATARGRYRLYVVDPESGQAGFIGTMMEGDKPVYIALRLGVREQKISEVELVVARGGAAGPPGLGTPGEMMEAHGAPRAKLVQTLPASRRADRDSLIRISDAYFANLQGSTGKTSAPFAPTCERLENGGQTTNLKQKRPGREAYDVLTLNCEQQQRSGFYAFVTDIRDRRFPIVDRERGLVLSYSFWDHTGTVDEMHLTNGMKTRAPFRAPLTFQIAEIFQIDNGRIDQIEAVINTVPYGMASDIWDQKK